MTAAILRFNKRIRVGGVRLQGAFDIFNVLNRQIPYLFDADFDGPGLIPPEDPVLFQARRSIRFGLRAAL